MDEMKKEFRVFNELFYRAGIYTASINRGLRKKNLGTDDEEDTKNQINNLFHLLDPPSPFPRCFI